VFAAIVQYDQNSESGETQIAKWCNYMTAAHLGSPLQRLAYIFSNPTECNDVSYNSFLKKYQETSWDSPAATSISESK